MAETTTFVSGHVTPEDGRVLKCNPLSVDVETSGYVLGDRRFQLRTIQLGDDTRCTIFTDPARSAWFARGALNQAFEIVAHAGTADLIPIWRESGASEAELESWFDKLTDTYIMSCLAFPLDMTHGLKPLAAKLLEDPKTAQGDAERAKYFRDNKWLTNTEHDTPVSRSGWANCDYTTPVMQNYASGDVFDAAGLAAYFKPQLPEGLLAVEREFRKITARVSWRGVQLDGKHLQKARSEVQTTLEDERDRLDGLGVELPSSSQQVCRALIAEGHLLPLTPQGNPSATAEVLAGLPQTDLVTSLRAWRKADKLRSSFLDPYYTAVKEGDGRVYPTILTLGASATGRTSCVGPNLQQVPREGGIRECLRADDGHVIVGADFSSVEVRVAAALSQDRHLIDLIVSGLDLHSLIAARVWGPDFTKENRYGAKRGVFGWLYGASVAKIARTLGITDRQAEAIIEALRGIAPGLVAWSQGIRNRVRNGQLQQWEHPSGRITVLDKHQSHKAVNYCIQSTARELLVGAMFRYEFADPGRTLLPIHDEILAFVPEAEAERLTGVLTRSMTTELLGMPIVCEARTPSRNWG